MGYLDSLDIANRALFHLGAVRIVSITENTKNNATMSFLYDKLRAAELRRNVWRFATRRAVIRPVTPTTLLVSPLPWSSTQLYLPGAIVADTNGVLWQSTLAENLNNQPGQSAAWDQYFGPMTADLFSQVSNFTAWSAVTAYVTGNQVSYQSVAYQALQNNTNQPPNTPSSQYWAPITINNTNGYYAGEMTYVPVSEAGGFGAAGYVVFLSMTNGNTDVPNVPTPWNPTVQYTADQTVSYNGSQWRNLLPINLNITPATPPAAWAAGTTYASGNQVTGADFYIYQSIGNGNLGNNPTNSGNPSFWTNTGVLAGWSSTPTLFGADLNWLPLQVSLTNLTFVYPVGSGPATDAETRNVFRLPSSFLREAPQDPKRGGVSYLGAPSGMMYDDWEFEGNFLVSRDAWPIVFRFVADIYQVSQFDDMFCEGLAARMAYEGCEDITQSIGKQGACAQAYNKFMADARTVNGIETGATEPPVDDYITCRA
jgi:hypothetical protein